MLNTKLTPSTVIISALGLTALSLPFSTPAEAVSMFDLFYDTGVGEITARISGTLQPDNNRVFVSSVTDPTFNGSSAPALPFIGTGDPLTMPPSGQAVLSLDGSALNFAACTDSACSDGFGFASSFFASGLSYGNFDAPAPFVPGNYSLTAVPLETDALPVVGSALLMAGGLWWKRKRSQAKVAELIIDY